jgi:hypothetical protein
MITTFQRESDQLWQTFLVTMSLLRKVCFPMLRSRKRPQYLDVRSRTILAASVESVLNGLNIHMDEQHKS